MPAAGAGRLPDVFAAFDRYHTAVSPTDVSRRADLPPATAHRLVDTLSRGARRSATGAAAAAPARG